MVASPRCPRRRSTESRATSRSTERRQAAPPRAAAACAVGLLAAGVSSADPEAWRVERVIDGDTLVANDGAGTQETVRLLGIDAPERGQYVADEAEAALSQACLGKPVRLARDPTADDRDDYRRLLRYAYCGADRSINAELVLSGLAYAYTRFPFARRDEFRELEERARQAAAGVWRAGGLAEMRWLAAHGKAPFRVHATGDRSWAVEYDCMVKTHVRPEQLARTLSRVRGFASELDAAELRAKLRAEGYVERDDCAR